MKTEESHNANTKTMELRIKAEDAFLLACNFRNVARLCAGDYPSKEAVTCKYIVPEIVNLSFSCELFMKSILISEKTAYQRDHKLNILFDLLSPPAQEHIIMEIKKKVIFESVSFHEMLERNANAFYEWRYFFELDVTPANIGFLLALSDSLCSIAKNYIYGSNAFN